MNETPYRVSVIGDFEIYKGYSKKYYDQVASENRGKDILDYESLVNLARQIPVNLDKHILTQFETLRELINEKREEDCLRGRQRAEAIGVTSGFLAATLLIIANFSLRKALTRRIRNLSRILLESETSPHVRAILRTAEVLENHTAYAIVLCDAGSKIPVNQKISDWAKNHVSNEAKSDEIAAARKLLTH